MYEGVEFKTRNNDNKTETMSQIIVSYIYDDVEYETSQLY